MAYETVAENMFKQPSALFGTQHTDTLNLCMPNLAYGRALIIKRSANRSRIPTTAVVENQLAGLESRDQGR